MDLLWIFISFVLSKFYSFPSPFPPSFHNFLLFFLILFSLQSLQNSFVWSRQMFLVTCLIRQMIHLPSQQILAHPYLSHTSSKIHKKTLIKDKTTKTFKINLKYIIIKMKERRWMCSKMHADVFEYSMIHDFLIWQCLMTPHLH